MTTFAECNAALGLPESKVILTVKETSTVMESSENHIRNMIRDGRLPAAQRGRWIRIPVVNLHKLLGLCD